LDAIHDLREIVKNENKIISIFNVYLRTIYEPHSPALSAAAQMAWVTDPKQLRIHDSPTDSSSVPLTKPYVWVQQAFFVLLYIGSYNV